MGLFVGSFLVLLTLKLTKVIAVSWWVVTAPIWGGAIFWLLILVVAFCLALLPTK